MLIIKAVFTIYVTLEQNLFHVFAYRVQKRIPHSIFFTTTPQESEKSSLSLTVLISLPSTVEGGIRTFDLSVKRFCYLSAGKMTLLY